MWSEHSVQLVQGPAIHVSFYHGQWKDLTTYEIDRGGDIAIHQFHQTSYQVTKNTIYLHLLSLYDSKLNHNEILECSRMNESIVLI